MPLLRSAQSLLLGFSLLCACGCSASNVTLENYNKIKAGMTRVEVEAILGPPHQKYQDTIFTWKNGETHTITVIIDDRGIVDRKDMEGL
ncbi:outer membrane protein assembly factor BamE [bacterium]|nr:outer membrane protein assembly factor BamE [bacterium]